MLFRSGLNMRCSFPTCEHDFSQNLSSGITFYRFPEDMSQRTTWKQSISQTNWNPEPGSIICSEHFLVKHVLETAVGHQIQRDAVPIINLSNNLDHNYSMKPYNVKVCRICLATDGEMCSMTTFKALNNAYEVLTGIKTGEEHQLASYVCSECARRLLDCARFRRKSLRARSQLLDAARRHGRITVELIQCMQIDLLNFEAVNANNDLDFGNEDLEHNELINIPNDSRQEDICDNYEVELGTDNKATVMAEANGIKIEDVDLCEPDDYIKVEIVADTVEDGFVEDLNVNAFVNEVIDDNTGNNSQGIEVMNNNSLVTKKWNKDADNDEIIECNDELSLFVEKSYVEYKEDVALNGSGKKDTPIRRQRAKKVTKKIIKKLLMKTDGDGKKFFCDICGKVFWYNYELKSHLITHTDKKPYSCKICKKSYRRERQLRLHYLSIHSKEKPYSCDICSKVFGHKDGLKSHLNKTHSSEKPYSCDICDKGFRYKHRLKIHSIIHSGERPYSCNICKRAFTHKNVLKSHLNSHSNEKPYTCRICEKAFKTNSSLRCHFRIHTGERPYSCDVCKKAFYLKQHLETHVTIHTDEKPYSCQVCNKPLKTKRTLQRHLRTHFLNDI